MIDYTADFITIRGFHILSFSVISAAIYLSVYTSAIINGICVCQDLHRAILDPVPGFRLHDFYIGLTNNPTSEVIPSPSPPTYDICKEYVGQFPSGTRLGVTCDNQQSGRYLIIQLQGNAGTLTLCEVEVYGGEYFV